MSVRTSILLPLLWAKTVQAAEPTPPIPAVFWADERILSVSGGISRGAYQAGQLYVLTSWLRQQPAPPPQGEPPHVVFSGSSAGSINALLGALTLSSLPPLEPGQWEAPEESAFFRTWVPLGFDMTKRSLDRAPAGKDPRDYQALINQPMLNEVAHHLALEWTEQLRVNYPEPAMAEAARWQVDLMLTTARQQPAKVPETMVTRQVTIPFGFHLAREGDALHLRPVPQGNDAVLGQGSKDNHQTAASPPPLEPPLRLDEVTRLVVPSSSIPGAFPVYSLPCDDYDRLVSPVGRVPCNPATKETVVWMIDGGTFEGNPIRVAHPMIDPSKDEDVPFLFLDPDLTDAQSSGPAAAEEMVNRYLQLGGGSGILGSIRNQSIDLYLLEHPVKPEEQGRSFMVTHTSPYGNLISGFFAFYDRSLRVWDFYAGMKDALLWLEENKLTGGVDPELWIPPSSLYKPVADCMEPHGLCKPFSEIAANDATKGTLETIIKTAPYGYQGVEDPAQNGLPQGVSAKEDVGQDLGWQYTPRDGAQLYDNLLRLSATYPARAKAEQEGAPLSLGRIAEHLTTTEGLAGAPFYATDLGCGPLHTELRERLLWQMERAYKRDILGHSLSTAALMSIASNSFAGTRQVVEWSARTPLREGGMTSAFVGLGTQHGEGVLVIPARVRLGAELPQLQGAQRRDETVEPTGNEWAWAGGADLGLGLRLPTDARRPPVVMGPRARSLVTLGVGAQLVTLRSFGEGATTPPLARSPAVWSTSEQETVSRQLQVTPFARYTALDVFFVDLRWYLGQESLGQSPPVGVNVGLQLRPANFVALREDGKR
jgi:hypothetical protein